MGLEIDAGNRRLRFTYPVLPPFLNEVEIKKLSVGDSRVDIMLRRYQNDVSVNVLRKEGPVEVIITK
ncbi:hypothetical protein [Geotalea toluenoxydans]|nr:hypothetical protein [Geotalea toluenoxydans]